MSKREMNLQLFAVDVPTATREMNKEIADRIYGTPSNNSLFVYQAAYLKGIEEDLCEVLRRMEEDDFLHALQGVHFMSNDLEKIAKKQEDIDADLKGIAKKLDGIEKALQLIASRIG